MLLEASFRSHQNVKNPFEFDYNQRASKVLHEKMFFGSPKKELSENSFEDRDESEIQSLNDRDSYTQSIQVKEKHDRTPDIEISQADGDEIGRMSLTVSNHSKGKLVTVSKRPFSGIDRNEAREVSDRSAIGRTSGLVSDDRTDPFTESGNFDRDTQDNFIAEEFEKFSVGGKRQFVELHQVLGPTE